MFGHRYNNAAAEGAISALAVQAGKGRAVLTGTHPELHPDWLLGAAAAEELAAAGLLGHIVHFALNSTTSFVCMLHVVFV